MAKLTAKARRALPKSSFAGPHRTFPINNASAPRRAAHLLGKASNPAAVKRRIISIAKRKGYPLPKAWQKGKGK